MDSKMKLTVTILIGLLAAVSGQGTFFDCNRERIDCSGGTCGLFGTATEGECACPGLTVTNKFNPCAAAGASDCADTAARCGGATDTACKVVAGTTTCFCPDTLWGNACQNERVNVTCNANDMVVEVTPFGNSADGTNTTFAGHIYNSLDKLNCNLTASGAKFTRTYNLDNTANSAGDLCVNKVTKDNTTSPTDIKYTVTLRVQHSVIPDVFLGTDLVIKATCSYSLVNNLEPISVTSVNAADTDVENIDDENTGQLVDLYIYKKSDSSDLKDTSGAIKVGDEVDLVFFMEDNDAFVNMIVKECKVNDGSATPGANEITLVNADGCPVYKKGIVVTGHTKQTAQTVNLKTGTVVKVPMRAFRFTSTLMLTFSCSVSVCDTANTADCEIANFDTTCGTAAGAIPSGANGRRRREAATEEFQLTASILVASSGAPFNSSADSLRPGQDSTGEKCWKEPRIQITVAILAVLAIILLVLCGIITACLICRRRHNKGDSFDNSSVASSTQHLTIPRPKV